jgi:hypothetical protein
MNKVHLFIDDISLEENTTELNDVYLETNDISAWGVWLEHDTWDKDIRGYNISFQNSKGMGFSLELNKEGIFELMRVLKEAIEKEQLNSGKGV